MCNIPFPVQLSPYNYERIEVVLQILQAADENVTSFSVVQVRKEALFSSFVSGSSFKSIVLFHRQWASFDILNPIRESLQPLMLRTRICWRTAFVQTVCTTADCRSTCLFRTNIIGRLSVSFTSVINHFDNPHS